MRAPFSGQVIQIDEARIQDHLDEMVRGTVEEALNAMVDAETDGSAAPGTTSAARHGRTCGPVAVSPCAQTVPMPLWALLASGQIAMRKVDGGETLSQPIEPATLDQAA
jgi:hypothetical protein